MDRRRVKVYAGHILSRVSPPWTVIVPILCLRFSPIPEEITRENRLELAVMRSYGRRRDLRGDKERGMRQREKARWREEGGSAADIQFEEGKRGGVACSAHFSTKSPMNNKTEPRQLGLAGTMERKSPTGKKFRSKPQLARYLGSSMDLSSIDFRTGKMLMNKLSKSRQRLRYDNNSQSKGKPDLNTSLPVRQTASIFKQPVTKVTNHPSNKVKTDPQKAIDQPRQLFWEKKLSGLNAFDIAEELVKTMDLPRGLQRVGPGCTDKTLLSAIASALHTSAAPITGQLSVAVEKNPGVWLNTTQPLCKAFMVTDDDIRKQEELVHSVRKRLEDALMADMLAHVEEAAREGSEHDDGDRNDDEDHMEAPPSTPISRQKRKKEPRGEFGGEKENPLFHLEIMEHNGVSLPGDTDAQSRDEGHQEALRFAFDQLSLMAVEKGDCGGGVGLVDTLDATGSISETCNGVGVGYMGLQMLEHPNGSLGSPTSCSPSPEYYGPGGYHMAVLGDPSSGLCSRKRSVNMTECVAVPSSEHVAEIVGRQGCKIKALRAKTNTYIKTPVRGEEPVFIVTGRREDVEMAKREILSAAEHFSMIRASRCKAGAAGGGAGAAGSLPGPPHLPGQTTIQVRVPYRVVGLVVGPKGATIKRIQQQTHTYIVTPSREKDPVFEVTGMPENVDRAREEIETHITLRTGAFVDLQGDNDFHRNGTDMPSASFHNAGLGSESCGAGAVVGSGPRGPRETGSPTSPFSTGSGGGFTFAGEPSPCLPAPPLRRRARQQRRNSSGPSAGGNTPRLSPTLPSDPALEHPLARRAQSDPLSALSWLQAGGAASFSGGSSSSSGGSTTGYSSSCSASSLPGGSPTDSEGGGSGVGGGGGTGGLLSRFKAAGGAAVAGGVGVGGGMAVAAANRDCYVCFESEVTAALVPCGHNLFCMDCAGQICQSADPECPVCRTHATQCIRIFS
ncbi:hypothetical protein SKAU_G00205030 [Synaphobranchus kaupii]|uniref:RING-type domain-containing protein n=1 Tax=Synaphobranchus kaupii TaxID=118154 RepID=A0A9Q1FG86_SYNKA|nr:hypothetical protein SKAU_G00205030 [Synaphobranchus kaupii]